MGCAMTRIEVIVHKKQQLNVPHLKKQILKDGDKFFLFSEFPYNYEIFPLSIIKGVSLTRRPSEHELYSLDNEYKMYPYRYILPMINLNIPAPQACFKISSNIHDQDELFSQFVIALYLVKSLRIGFSGSFIYTINEPCCLPELHHLNTTINSGNNEKYTADDIKEAVKIFKRIRKLKRNPRIYCRMVMAISSLEQIIWTKSYSMVYQELFACLGILFAAEPDGENLGNFVRDFLSSIDSQRAAKIGKWVCDEYRQGRSKLAHGNPAFWKTAQKQFSFYVGSGRYKKILKLYGVVKLCFLGFLGLPLSQLREYSEKGENKAKAYLKGLKASNCFLPNLTIRIDHKYGRIKK
jgi:hypothetical protein